jgi:hypothetical protein
MSNILRRFRQWLLPRFEPDFIMAPEIGLKLHRPTNAQLAAMTGIDIEQWQEHIPSPAEWSRYQIGEAIFMALHFGSITVDRLAIYFCYADPTGECFRCFERYCTWSAP